MVFDNLSELGTLLSDGFMIDEIVSLLQKKDYQLNINDFKLLNRAESYFELAKQGHNFYVNQKYPLDDADDVLNAFKNIVYILVNFFDKPNLKKADFLNELQMFENEIKSVVREEVVTQNKVKNTLKLFRLLGKILLGEFDKLSGVEI